VNLPVGSGNDNVEVLAVLAVVDGIDSVNRASPEDTLDQSGRVGIGAFGG